MDGAKGSQQAAEDVQVTAKFVTKLPAEFRVPETPVAVPANLTRYGLSQIINHLLALDPVRPFDFLINGELLRLSLAKHLQAKQISTEAVLEVEYVPAVLPPTPKEQYPHDDWVSCLAPLASGAIASGCYDGVVRVWGPGDGGSAGEPISSFAAHKGPVKAAAAVRSGQGQLLLTAGGDMVARLWRGVGPREAGGPGRPEPLAVLRGHSEGIEAAAANGDGNACCTGGWDSKLLLWQSGDALLAAMDAGAGDEEQQAARKAAAKKRKVGGAAANGVAAAPHEETPRGELAGHTQCVSSVVWASAGTIISGSWDHSVRAWDVETQVNTETLNHNKAVYCVAAPPGAGSSRRSGLVAFGGAERALRVWDPRTRAGEGLALRALPSHADWIAGLAWHPTSAHHVVSASHDHTLKLWDLRTAVPLHTLAGHTDKVLCCAWVAEDLVASGGADCTLRTAQAALEARR